MKTNPENSCGFMQQVLPVLEAHEDWTVEALHEAVMAFIKTTDLKNGQVLCL